MTPLIRQAACAAVLGLGAIASSQAGTLDYQGVTFTSSWDANVLTLEIDAAHPAGDWATATTIGALQLKDVGTFSDVTLTSAPGGAANWTLSSRELNANGCGGGAHAGSGLCFSGQHVALTDDMVFQFTFGGGATDFTSPHVKVNLFANDADSRGGRKVGSLLSENIPPALAPVPEPETWAMFAGGLAVLGAVTRRRTRSGRRA